MVVLARDEADKESSSNAQQACDFMAISIKKNSYYCFCDVDKYAFCHACQAFFSLSWVFDVSSTWIASAVPWPGWLSICISPPSACTRSRMLFRPKAQRL